MNSPNPTADFLILRLKKKKKKKVTNTLSWNLSTHLKHLKKTPSSCLWRWQKTAWEGEETGSVIRSNKGRHIADSVGTVRSAADDAVRPVSLQCGKHSCLSSPPRSSLADVTICTNLNREKMACWSSKSGKLRQFLLWRPASLKSLQQHTWLDTKKLLLNVVFGRGGGGGDVDWNDMMRLAKFVGEEKHISVGKTLKSISK